jgi:hypothetical protein
MMTGVLLSDVANRTSRLKALQMSGLPVVRIVPHDFPPVENGLSITVPKNWLPAKGDQKKKGWWKAETIFLAAYQELPEKWDYVWCIESDLKATPALWRELFEKTASADEDMLGVKLKTRQTVAPWHWWKNSAPLWANDGCLGCIYRLSRRAVEWLAADAVANREIFCEVIVPSVIVRRGGRIRELKEVFDCYDNQSLDYQPTLAAHEAKLWHPVKQCTSDEPA